ncbi:MAG: DUF3326 domain-containing protein [Planctomycetes bacterium]|nr:DUF3326 domain-containing protein [Planctomycetota bacterium]
MNVVMIIPTGIGCEIGGHAGDATPAARLLGACCDKIILHPNVVNASDINEMPENALYVEGSILDRLLEGKIELQEVKQNKILVVVSPPVGNHTINAVSAARTTLGADIVMLELAHSFVMRATMENGIASGEVEGWEDLIDQVRNKDFEALAIATPITVSNEVMIEYFESGGINPIGGVEARASKLIADVLNKPVAHAPYEEWRSELWDFNEVVDPRLAAEMVSTCYLHCVLKGLHKAPRISKNHTGYGMGLSVKDIDVMVSPYGCYGRPHRACQDARIPIIVVKENTCVNKVWQVNGAVYVENYIEAAGLLMAMRAGIHPSSVRRPLKMTEVINAD